MKKIKAPKDNFQFVIQERNGKKFIELLSSKFFQHFLNTKTKVGDKGTLIVDMKKITRSESQLNYYFVICGLIGENSGYTKDEVHDALTVLKWGTKEVIINGRKANVRHSISDAAQFPKIMMAEQIKFALENAFDLQIHVPTKQSLGYIDD